MGPLPPTKPILPCRTFGSSPLTKSIISYRTFGSSPTWPPLHDIYIHYMSYAMTCIQGCIVATMSWTSHLQYGQFRYVRGSSMLSFCAFRMYTPTRKTAAHRLMNWERHDWDVQSITEWPQRFPFQLPSRFHWITKTRYSFLCCHHPNRHPFMLLPTFFVMNHFSTRKIVPQVQSDRIRLFFLCCGVS